MTDPDNDIEKTQERPSKTPYADMSTEMIKRATESDDAEMRIDDMRSFLKNIAAAADQGEIVGSKNHVYTSDKFDAQLKEFVRAFAHGPKEEDDPGVPALQYITGTKGLRGAFDALINNDKTSVAFFEALNERVFPRPEAEAKPEFVPDSEIVKEVGETGVDAAELAERSDEFTMEASIDKASLFVEDVTPEEIVADTEEAEALAEPEAELVAEADAELETEGVPAELEVSEPEEVEQKVEVEKSKEPTLEEIAHDGKYEYDRRVNNTFEGVRSAVNQGITRIENSAGEIDSVVNGLSNGVEVAKITSMLTHIEDYPTPAVRTSLSRLNNELQDSYNLLQRAIDDQQGEFEQIKNAAKSVKNEIDTVVGELEDIDVTFEQHLGAEAHKKPDEQVPDELHADSAELQADLKTLSGSLTEFLDTPIAAREKLEQKARRIQGIMAHLNEMDQTAARGFFDPEEIASVVGQIKGLVADQQGVFVSGSISSTLTGMRAQLASAGQKRGIE
ncbi:MAG: hypothetical protein WA030_01300 [Candidatus Microsaccharimonas sp.]